MKHIYRSQKQLTRPAPQDSYKIKDFKKRDYETTFPPPPLPAPCSLWDLSFLTKD